MVTIDTIHKALSVIQDPDLHRDIVSLGFVKNVKIEGGRVSLEIELTTPGCPVKAEFKKTAEQILLGLEGVAAADVHMTSQSPPLENQVNGLQGVAAIIAVASCKGGVGRA